MSEDTLLSYAPATTGLPSRRVRFPLVYLAVAGACVAINQFNLLFMFDGLKRVMESIRWLPTVNWKNPDQVHEACDMLNSEFMLMAASFLCLAAVRTLLRPRRTAKLMITAICAFMIVMFAFETERLFYSILVARGRRPMGSWHESEFGIPGLIVPVIYDWLNYFTLPLLLIRWLTATNRAFLSETIVARTTAAIAIAMGSYDVFDLWQNWGGRWTEVKTAGGFSARPEVLSRVVFDCADNLLMITVATCAIVYLVRPSIGRLLLVAVAWAFIGVRAAYCLENYALTIYRATAGGNFLQIAFRMVGNTTGLFTIQSFPIALIALFSAPTAARWLRWFRIGNPYWIGQTLIDD